ncbi:MAG: methyl-accepting chemotaxis protein [Planctomycetota bacterium]
MTISNNKPARGKAKKSAGADLGLALDVATNSVLVVDGELRVQFVNRAARQALGVFAGAGVAPDQVVGSSLTALAGPRAGAVRDGAWSGRGAVGNEVVDWSGNPMFADSGAFQGAVVSFEVVTEQVRREAQSGEASKLVAAVGQQQAVIEFRLDGTIVTANQNFLDALGYTLGEIQGKHHRMFLDAKESNTAEYTQFWQALNRGEPQTGQFRRVAKGGRELWINATYFPITDDSGKPVKVVKFASDVTKEREAMQVAKRSSDSMDAVATNILICDADFNITYGNKKSAQTLRLLEPALQAKFGLTAEQAAHGSIDRFHKNPKHQRDLLRSLRGRNHQAEFQLDEHWVSLSASGLFDHEGNFTGAIVNWEVVTEQKRMAKEIEDRAAAEAAAASVLRGKVDSLLKTVEEAARGDLTARHDVAGSDPVGQLGEGLTRMIGDLRSIIVQIKEGAEQFSASAGTISNASSSLSEASQTNAATVEEMTASVDQLTDSIRMIAQNASDANSIADETSRRAKAGGEAVDRSITAMKEINRSSEQISEIIQVISEIASQTNLLALNAAIEAARAGEHGLGFAVVADEVRKLAERSSEAAKQITGLIRESTQRVVEGTKLSEETGQALTQIIDGVTSTAESISQIASATDEQSATAQEVARAIQNVAKLTENNSGNATDMAASAQELSAQAVAMKELVRRFRI